MKRRSALTCHNGLSSVDAGNYFVMPSAAEWWKSSRYVLLIFTILIALALAGSFISYEQVIARGHPWLPARQCPGCPFCGMTRSFCAMSSGRWEDALKWNRGGPTLYAIFWLWLLSGMGLCVTNLFQSHNRNSPRLL